MTRAKRIEEAARALLDAVCTEPRNVPGASIALRAALALPEEESEAGWIVTRKGSPLAEGIVCTARPAAGSLLEKLVRMDEREVRRVRITVEGEEGER